MKRILRNYSINLLALFLTSQIATGIIYKEGLETYLIASFALTVATMLGKPVINILLLPLNLVTFGVFRWVSSAVALYLVTLVVKTFKIEYFNFTGITTKWIDIPEMYYKGIIAYIAFAFVISLIISFVQWLRK
ncbi:hypothetical protein A2Z22_04505 [Candidatus Woesebacteria bacterium RBG_16_34_12]|uniref:Uncharacterized protein n=1 Tax=Candidatus Woesebacteria bacterium RBG_16_34_12 TaxID=1802480 RepID=A0A1F7XBL5_9BACT|nr:MAG: hypothetical protein A2Z22_04505 [Candidatus Woesebacteria bacterium RBG_16_34_12]